jgi:putative nucleotidyltransferase with HDIG domain
MVSSTAPFCIEKNIENIPTLETSKMRLFNILQDENTNAGQVEKVLSSDPAMAAKIIKLANSPFYRHSQQTLGIRQSLLTIGLDMVKCIVLSMAVMESFGTNTKLAVQLWRHSYATALMALSLSADTKEKESLFAGALLHDLGRMVLLFKVPDAYIPLFDVEGNRPDIDMEQEVFLTDHTIIGEAVARRWHFPPEIIGVIRHHHTPQDRVSALVFLINHILLQLERDLPPDISEHSHLLANFFGKRYNDLVNTIMQRYKINTVIIENLF